MFTVECYFSVLYFSPNYNFLVFIIARCQMDPLLLHHIYLNELLPGLRNAHWYNFFVLLEGYIALNQNICSLCWKPSPLPWLFPIEPWSLTLKNHPHVNKINYTVMLSWENTVFLIWWIKHTFCFQTYAEDHSLCITNCLYNYIWDHF